MGGGAKTGLHFYYFLGHSKCPPDGITIWIFLCFLFFVWATEHCHSTAAHTHARTPAPAHTRIDTIAPGANACARTLCSRAHAA